MNLGQLADATGHSDNQRFAGYGGSRYDGSGADEHIVANVAVLEANGVDADHNVVADLAAVDHRAVSHQDVVAQFQVIVSVQDAVVLDGAVLADDDLAVVAADNGAGPDAGALADDDVAHDVGCLADEHAGVNLRGFAVDAADQNGSPD